MTAITTTLAPASKPRQRLRAPNASAQLKDRPLRPALTQQPAKQVDYFPHLPPYTNPTEGVLSKLPLSWVPYAQLMRIDRPGGLYAFYFPYLIGLIYAACIAPTKPAPEVLLRNAAILLPFNVVLRGIACTWNDNVDQKFDRQVERTRHRPIARGAVSTTAANVFTIAQTAALAPALYYLFPEVCVPHMVTAVVMFLIYALMKRVTYYPQVFLGFPFAWAILFTVAALDMEPLELPYAPPTLALFGSNVLWTITYDTIYAHQDVADDERAGVKGMALRFRNSTKLLACVLSAGQVFLLAVCGDWAGFGTPFFVGSVGGVSLAMAYYIWDVDLSRPESCGAWFRDQFWIVGLGYVAGLTAEYINRA